MKSEFVLYKEGSSKPIIVNENSNVELLQRCQDNWSHKLDIKYVQNKKWHQKIGERIFQNKKLEPQILFVHIPKTGGTSFKFNVIYSPYITKKIAIYHKINFPPKDISELNIFKEKKTMFTILRNPINTVISAFYHFNHIQKTNLLDFAYQASNMQIKFLLGYDITSDYKVTEDDFENVKKLINERKLIIGIHKTEKMNDIYNLLGLPLDKVDKYVLNKKVDVKYALKDISGDMKNYVKKMNVYDNMLYAYILNS